MLLRPRAGDHLGGGGVDGVAGRLAAHLPRRPRLRLQVEHGLDARHARLLPAGPDLPPLPPPRADVQPDVRVQRELRAAAVARRGRARQGLAATTRCPATAGRSSPTCARCTPTCGRTPARSCSSWAASSPRSGSGATSARSTGTCSSSASNAGIQSLVRDLNGVYRDEPALWELDSDPAGFWWLEANDAADNVVAFARRSADGERVLVFVANLSPGAARPLSGSACRARGRWREVAQHRLELLRRQRRGQPRRRPARADPVARPALLGRADAAAARRHLARAG